MIRVTEVDGDGVMEMRRIRLQLDQPTRGKETELFLLTDLPPGHAGAPLVAETYRRRWTLEDVFQSLTEALNCEINTLADPKAALFGFCVALVAYNLLAVVRAALRSEHGHVEVEAKASN
jgi:IS4 transposase